MLNSVEEQVKKVDNEIKEELKSSEEAPLLMSIPGVGPLMTFLAYVGNGSRFSSASQVSHYTGLTPRVDCSGNKQVYGGITKRGCTAIHRVAVQAAWSWWGAAIIHHSKRSFLNYKKEQELVRL